VLGGVERRGGAAADVELRVDVLDVVRDRLGSHAESPRDLLVGQSPSDERQELSRVCVSNQTEYLQFSPAKEMAEVEEQMMRNMQAYQT